MKRIKESVNSLRLRKEVKKMDRAFHYHQSSTKGIFLVREEVNDGGQDVTDTQKEGQPLDIDTQDL